ncbi:MAG: recombinase RecT, partial [Nitrososphaeraceae archaeon]|nr:recombinase RecT [Nitrososphaeraceae archaeon]
CFKVTLDSLEKSQQDAIMRCGSESLMHALLAAVRAGFYPSPYNDDFYFIPRGGKVRFEPSYKGIVRKMLEQPSIRIVKSAVVYKQDKIEVSLGSHHSITHLPNLIPNEKEKNEIIGAYCIVQLEDHSQLVEWTPRKDLLKAKEASEIAMKGKTSPAWRNWEEQMFRKLPIRRINNLMKQSDDLKKILSFDEFPNDEYEQNTTVIIEKEERDNKLKEIVDNKVASIEENKVLIKNTENNKDIPLQNVEVSIEKESNKNENMTTQQHYMQEMKSALSKDDK